MKDPQSRVSSFELVRPQEQKFVLPLYKAEDGRAGPAHKIKISRFDSVTQDRISYSQGYVSVKELLKDAKIYKRRVQSAKIDIRDIPQTLNQRNQTEYFNKKWNKPSKSEHLSLPTLSKCKSTPVLKTQVNKRQHSPRRLFQTYTPRLKKESVKEDKTVSRFPLNSTNACMPSWPSSCDLQRLSNDDAEQNEKSVTNHVPSNAKPSKTVKIQKRNKLFIGPIVIPSHTNVSCILCEKLCIEDLEDTPVLTYKYSHAEEESKIHKTGEKVDDEPHDIDTENTGDDQGTETLHL